MGDQPADQHGLSALLSFTASNVRSYKDEAHLSLLSTRLARPELVRDLQWESGGKTVGVLPAAGVFGANASGKSTILRAMADMRLLVLGSFRHGGASSRIPRRPFLLDEASKAAPSRFELDLILEGVRWQYGFEVNDREVLGEYALHYPNGRQALVFEREGEEFSFGPPFRSVGRLLENLVRHNSLLVSAAGAVGRSPLARLFSWFQTNLMVAESSNRGLRAARTADLAQSPESRERVLSLLLAADLGVTDISRESVDPDMSDRLRRALPILTGQEGDPDAEEDEFIIEDFVRLTHSGEREDVDFDPGDESLGTLVWVGLVGPVLDTLDRGDVLLADELDASLHPHLVDRLIELFQSPTTNKRCAQLIFNAHDVTLLGDSERRRLSRDQIWFTQKNANGATDLYPLADFSPRKDEALERRYLLGRFGALPVLDPGEFALAAELVER